MNIDNKTTKSMICAHMHQSTQLLGLGLLLLTAEGRLRA